MPAASPATAQLTEAFITARRTGATLDPAKLTMPANLAEALAVQAAVTTALNAKIGGWKVGISPEKVPIAAPIYTNTMHAAPATLTLPKSGKIGIEVEVAVRLGKDLTPRPGRPYTRSEIHDAIDTILIGIEPVESRFGEPMKAGFLGFVADNMANFGYVTGAELKDWRALDLAHLSCTLEVDGKVVHDKVGGHAAGDPFAWLTSYANSEAQHLGGLRAGQVITTGSLNGVHWLDVAATVKARLGGIGEVGMKVVWG